MHEARLRVIYGDTDQMGVVYYANYFRYFEYARGEFFRAHGGDYRALESQGLMLPVVEATCTYKASVRYDDLIVIRAWIGHVGGASFSFQYEIRKEGEDVVLASGRTAHALINTEGKPQRIPEDLRALLEQGKN